MSDNIIIAVVTAVGTLISSGVLTFFINKRKLKNEESLGGAESDRQDFSILADMLNKDNARLRKEVDELKDEIRKFNDRFQAERDSHRKEIDALRSRVAEEERLRNDITNKLSIFETSHHDLPLPQWLKDTSGVMLSVNDAYVEAFIEPQGKSRSDYVGKTDIEFWGEEIGRRYQKNDAIVRARRRALSFKEKVVLAGIDVSDEFVFLKYPRFAGRTLIGIGGICFPVSYYVDRSNED